MGIRWMPPSSSSVARFAISVFERSSSISVGLSTIGIFAAPSDERLVMSDIGIVSQKAL
ncbi:MAG TPA: hypothetical protein VFH28_04055 [Nitrososphaera sp.]|nr:hypothetical protein [Nitrososphaera sp.]